MLCVCVWGGGGGGGERGLINLILHTTECDDSIVISLLFFHVIEEICSNSTNSCRQDICRFYHLLISSTAIQIAKLKTWLFQSVHEI